MRSWVIIDLLRSWGWPWPLLFPWLLPSGLASDQFRHLFIQGGHLPLKLPLPRWFATAVLSRHRSAASAPSLLVSCAFLTVVRNSRKSVVPLRSASFLLIMPCLSVLRNSTRETAFTVLCCLSSIIILVKEALKNQVCFDSVSVLQSVGRRAARVTGFWLVAHAMQNRKPLDCIVCNNAIDTESTILLSRNLYNLVVLAQKNCTVSGSYISNDRNSLPKGSCHFVLYFSSVFWDRVSHWSHGLGDTMCC